MTDNEIAAMATEMDDMMGEMEQENTDERTVAQQTVEKMNEIAVNFGFDSAEAAIKLASRKPREPKPSFFDNDKNIIEALAEIETANGEYHPNNDGATVSRVLSLQLLERGLLQVQDSAETREGKRGRAKRVFSLTSQGKSLLGDSCGPQEEIAEQLEEIEAETV